MPEYVVKHRQRARPVGGQFQHIKAQAFGGFDRTLAMRRNRAFDQRHQVTGRFGGRHRRGVHPAAPAGTKAAATRAHLKGGLRHLVSIRVAVRRRVMSFRIADGKTASKLYVTASAGTADKAGASARPA